MNGPGKASKPENFLVRWSRRKSAQPEEAAPSAPDTTKAPEPVAHPETPPLPPLESLDASSDYSGFLSPEVDDELQRLALRKLFGTAGFHVRDGLDDYDEDYRSFESLGDIVTAEMRHRVEHELQREADALELRDTLAAHEPSAAEVTEPDPVESEADKRRSS